MENLARRRSCAAVGIVMLLCSAACKKSSARAEQQLLEDRIRATYRVTFEGTPADYVIITYPESVEMLPRAKQTEYRIVRSVLDDLGILHDSKSYSEVLTTFVGKTSGREHFTFDLPLEIAKRCRNGIVVYLHLDLQKRTRIFSHPNSLEYGIKIQFMCDPVAVG